MVYQLESDQYSYSSAAIIPPALNIAWLTKPPTEKRATEKYSIISITVVIITMIIIMTGIDVIMFVAGRSPLSNAVMIYTIITDMIKAKKLREHQTTSLVWAQFSFLFFYW